jgi:hypothetical protein
LSLTGSPIWSNSIDQFRRQRARHEETLRIVGMAHADMAVGIDHVFVGENAIGDDEVAQEIVKLAHDGSFRVINQP